MATIDQNLAAIMDAVYGKDVRQAIHDSIEQCHEDVLDLTNAIGNLEIPAIPSANGNYKLRLTVSGGTATYSWVAE